jgi:thiamine biosynthesis lipoprotein ApbE
MEQSVLIAIKGGLFVIEKCLRDILEETKNESKSEEWLLKVRRSDVSAHAAAQLTVKAEEMLKEIQELQNTFNIGQDTESARGRIISDLTQIWTILSELSPRRLLGYGRIRPEEGNFLKARVNRMNAIREDMDRILS